MATRLVYSPHYNIGFFGLERLHPFDSKKYGRAWKTLRRRFGADLKTMAVRPRRPISRDELLTVHESQYLKALRKPAYVAGALELPPVRFLPYALIDWCVLRPMRWATMGTVIAAREALEHGLAVNLSGGYHHAKPNGGEGFCIYNDIAIAVEMMRREKRIAEDSRIAYIDLDAHQGNGVSHAFMNDSRMFMFDAYNSLIYPYHDLQAHDRVDCAIRLTENCTEGEYMRELEGRLPGFLESISKNGEVSLAVYNAGTDVFEKDPLGNLPLSAAAVLQRDEFVVSQLRENGLPTVMLLSGGYTSVSYKLVADSVIRLVEQGF